jgi:hypothetical protein
MHLSTSHRPRCAVGADHLFAPDRVDQPHTITVTDIAAACAALDYGCAAWSSRQVDAVVARDEEDDHAIGGQFVHKVHRGV